MKSQVVAGAATLVAALGVATVSVAAANPGSAGAKSRTIQATAKPTHGHQIDSGRHGPSAGDQVEFGGRITGGVSGTFDATCVNTSRTRQICAITFRLSHGTITAQADYGVAGSTAVTAVTGGTGKYAGASGQLHEREVHGGRIDRLVFDLSGVH